MCRRELRALTAEELEKLKRMSRSSESATGHDHPDGSRRRTVRRDWRNRRCSPDSASRWVKRFNEAGLSGLADRPRPGRQRMYSEQERGQMMAVAHVS